uniref:uncharacterized protein rab44 n=1 Tax=Semicossyphus pulcher TaxID=241346 RepID=UPI0037E7559A
MSAQSAKKKRIGSRRRVANKDKTSEADEFLTTDGTSAQHSIPEENISVDAFANPEKSLLETQNPPSPEVTAGNRRKLGSSRRIKGGRHDKDSATESHHKPREEVEANTEGDESPEKTRMLLAIQPERQENLSQSNRQDLASGTRVSSLYLSEEKLSDLYFVTEKDSKDREENTKVLRQDGNLQGNCLVNESNVDSVVTHFSVAAERTTGESSHEEHTEVELNVGQVTFSSANEELSTKDEPKEIFNLSEVKDAQQSDDVEGQVNEQGPTQVYAIDNYDESETHDRQSSEIISGNLTSQSEVRDTYQTELECTDNSSTKQEGSNPDVKRDEHLKKEGDIDAFESKTEDFHVYDTKKPLSDTDKVDAESTFHQKTERVLSGIDLSKSSSQMLQSEMNTPSDSQPQDNSVPEIEHKDTGNNSLGNRRKLGSSRRNKGRQEVKDSAAESAAEDITSPITPKTTTDKNSPEEHFEFKCSVEQAIYMSSNDEQKEVTLFEVKGAHQDEHHTEKGFVNTKDNESLETKKMSSKVDTALTEEVNDPAKDNVYLGTLVGISQQTSLNLHSNSTEDQKLMVQSSMEIPDKVLPNLYSVTEKESKEIEEDFKLLRPDKNLQGNDVESESRLQSENIDSSVKLELTTENDSPKHHTEPQCTVEEQAFSSPKEEFLANDVRNEIFSPSEVIGARHSEDAVNEVHDQEDGHAQLQEIHHFSESLTQVSIEHSEIISGNLMDTVSNTYQPELIEKSIDDSATKWEDSNPDDNVLKKQEREGILSEVEIGKSSLRTVLSGTNASLDTLPQDYFKSSKEQTPTGIDSVTESYNEHKEEVLENTRDIEVLEASQNQGSEYDTIMPEIYDGSLYSAMMHGYYSEAQNPTTSNYPKTDLEIVIPKSENLQEDSDEQESSFQVEFDKSMGVTPEEMDESETLQSQEEKYDHHSEDALDKAPEVKTTEMHEINMSSESVIHDGIQNSEIISVNLTHQAEVSDNNQSQLTDSHPYEKQEEHLKKEINFESLDQINDDYHVKDTREPQQIDSVKVDNAPGQGCKMEGRVNEDLKNSYELTGYQEKEGHILEVDERESSLQNLPSEIHASFSQDQKMESKQEQDSAAESYDGPSEEVVQDTKENNPLETTKMLATIETAMQDKPVNIIIEGMDMFDTAQTEEVHDQVKDNAHVGTHVELTSSTADQQLTNQSKSTDMPEEKLPHECFHIELFRQDGNVEGNYVVSESHLESEVTVSSITQELSTEKELPGENTDIKCCVEEAACSSSQEESSTIEEQKEHENLSHVREGGHSDDTENEMHEEVKPTQMQETHQMEYSSVEESESSQTLQSEMNEPLDSQPQHVDGFNLIGNRRKLGSSRRNKGRQHVKDTVTVKGAHHSDDALDDVHEQEVKPTQMQEIDLFSETVIHNATKNPEIISGDLIEQSEVSDIYKSEEAVKTSDDSLGEQEEQPTKDINFEALDQRNDDYHVDDARKPHQLSDTVKVDNAPGQAYKTEGHVQDDIKNSYERTGYQEKEGFILEVEERESSLQNLPSEMHASFSQDQKIESKQEKDSAAESYDGPSEEVVQDTKENNPLETTKMLATIETAMQEKPVDTIMEGMDMFDTAQTEEVHDQVKDNAHVELTSLSLHSSSTADQQLTNQSKSTEMPEEKLPHECFVTEKETKEKDEDIESFRQDGNCEGNYVVSESHLESEVAVSSIIQELSTEKELPGENTDIKCGVEQAARSSSQEELSTIEEQKEHENLSHVREGGHSDDTENEMHEEVKPTQMQETHQMDYSSVEESESSQTLQSEMNEPLDSQPQHVDGFNLIGNRRKLGSSRRNRGRQHVKDTVTVKGAHHSDDALNDVHEQEVKPTQMQEIDLFSETVTHNAPKNPEIISGDLIEQSEVSDIYKTEEAVKTSDDSLGEQEEQPTKDINFEALDQRNDDYHVDDARKPHQLSDTVKVDNAPGQAYKTEGHVQDDIKISYELTGYQEKEGFILEVDERESSLQNLPSEIHASFSQDQKIESKQEKDSAAESYDGPSEEVVQDTKENNPLETTKMLATIETAMQEKPVDTIMEGMDMFDTAQTEEVHDQVKDNAHVELTSLSLHSSSTADQQLTNQSKSTDMPEEKLPHECFVTEKETKEKDEDIESFRQDGNCEGNYVVSESHLESEVTVSSITQELSTEKEFPGENTDIKCGVEQAARSSSHEELSTIEEQKEHENLSHVREGGHSDDTENEMHEEVKPTQMQETHQMEYSSVEESECSQTLQSEMIETLDSPPQHVDGFNLIGNRRKLGSSRRNRGRQHVKDTVTVKGAHHSDDALNDVHEQEVKPTQMQEIDLFSETVIHNAPKNPEIISGDLIEQSEVSDIYKSEEAVKTSDDSLGEQEEQPTKDINFEALDQRNDDYHVDDARKPHQLSDTDTASSLQNLPTEIHASYSQDQNVERKQDKDSAAEPYNEASEEVQDTKENNPSETTKMSVTIETAMQEKSMDTTLEGMDTFDSAGTEEGSGQVEDNAPVGTLVGTSELTSLSLLSSSTVDQQLTNQSKSTEMPEEKDGINPIGNRRKLGSSRRNKGRQHVKDTVTVKGAHHSDDALNNVHEQEVKPTQIQEIDLFSETVIHNAPKNPEIISGDLIEQSEVSDIYKSEVAVKTSDDSLGEQEEQPTKDLNFEALDQRNDDYHVDDARKPHQLSDTDTASSLQNLPTEIHASYSQDQNVERKQDKDSAAEPYNEASEEVQDTKENNPSETTKMSATIETAMQEKSMDTTLEGMDTFDSAGTEEGSGQVEDNAPVGTLVGTSELTSLSLLSSSTVDQQLTNQSKSTEMPEEKDGINPIGNRRKLGSSRRNKGRQHVKDTVTVKGAHHSDDALNYVHEQEVKPTQMQEIDLFSETVIHNATKNPEIISGDLIEQSEVSDIYKSEVAVKTSDDSLGEQEEQPTKDLNFEALDQRNDDYHVDDARKPHQLSDTDTASSLQNLPTEIHASYSQDQNVERKQDKDSNEPSEEVQDTKENKPSETTKMSVTIQMAMQEKSMDNTLEGMDTFDSARTEEGSGLVEDNAQVGTLVGTSELTSLSLLSSSTVDQQLTNQSKSTEMPEDGINPIGNRRKLGSSRRSKGRQHVKNIDTDTSEGPKEELVEKRGSDEALNIKTTGMTLALEKTTQEESEEPTDMYLKPSEERGNIIPAINDKEDTVTILPQNDKDTSATAISSDKDDFVKSCQDINKEEKKIIKEPENLGLRSGYDTAKTDLIQSPEESVGKDDSDIENISYHDDIVTAKTFASGPLEQDAAYQVPNTEALSCDTDEEVHQKNYDIETVGHVTIDDDNTEVVAAMDVPVSGKDKVGESFKDPTRKDHEVQEIITSQEMPELFSTSHNKTDFRAESAVDVPSESGISAVVVSSNSQENIEQTSLDESGNLLGKSKPRKRRMGSNRRMLLKENPDEGLANKDETKQREFDVDAEVRNSQKVEVMEEVPTLATAEVSQKEEAKPSLSLGHKNQQETNESVPDLGQKLQSSTSNPQSNMISDKNPLLTSNTEESTNTGGSFVSLGETTESAHNDEERPQSANATQIQASNSAEEHVAAVVDLEIVKSAVEGLDEKQKNAEVSKQESSNVDEGAQNTILEMDDALLNPTHRRRKIGSTRKSLGSKTKVEDLPQKQEGDNEATDAATNEDLKTKYFTGIKEEELQIHVEQKDSDSGQKKDKALETVEYSHAGDSDYTPVTHQTSEENPASNNQLVETEHQLTPNDLLAIHSASPKQDAMAETESGRRRRKMGSHRKSRGKQNNENQTAREERIIDPENGSDDESISDESAIKTTKEDSLGLDTISEVDETKTASSNISTSKAGRDAAPVSEKTPEQGTPVQHPPAEIRLGREGQNTFSLADNIREVGDRSNCYNVVMLGDSSVGKTSFMKRAQSGKFSLDLPASVGLDSCMWTVVVDGKPVVLKLWDTAGQERFHSITRQIFHKAQAFLLMYDITSLQSFSAVSYWASCIQEGAAENVTILLLGNKSDHAERRVKSQEGEALAKEYNFEFMECSAATGENVIQSLETVARMLSQKADTREEATVLFKEPQQKKSSGCC